ncbi:MAG TPA: hypothetical protein VM238_18455 [Phycisphaerae bacterium]|nr:hypothetical protein [Phycisphaerae bacterium]
MDKAEIEAIARDFAALTHELGHASGDMAILYVQEILAEGRRATEALTNLPELFWLVGSRLRDTALEAHGARD